MKHVMINLGSLDFCPACGWEVPELRDLPIGKSRRCPVCKALWEHLENILITAPSPEAWEEGEVETSADPPTGVSQEAWKSALVRVGNRISVEGYDVDSWGEDMAASDGLLVSVFTIEPT